MNTITPLRRLFPAAAFASLTTVAGACSPPVTDIVATVSEDVGAFDLAGATREGDTFRAFLCVEHGSESDTIANRVLLQLRNKGYQRIELAVTPTDGSDASRAVWTPSGGVQMDAGRAAGENPCTSTTEAHE